MREVGQVVIGLALLGLGLASVVAALVPRWRGSMRWRSGARCGLVSGLGAGAVFAVNGALVCLDGLLPAPARACCGVAIVAGLPAVVVGSWLDHRRPAGE